MVKCGTIVGFGTVIIETLIEDSSATPRKTDLLVCMYNYDVPEKSKKMQAVIDAYPYPMLHKVVRLHIAYKWRNLRRMKEMEEKLNIV